MTAIPPSPAPVPVAAAYTSDGDNMLRAARTAPEDDAPRLAYADWLDERGRAGDAERAEFIRVQCELARYDLHTERPNRIGRFDALRSWERKLLAANFGAWTDSLPESMVTKQCPHCAEQAPDYETNVVECRQCDCTGLAPDHDNVGFRRGFVASVALPTAAFVGGETCGRCDGDGVHPDYTGRDEDVLRCPACSGTGTCRTPGLAAALFAAHPVTEVKLADRVPLEFDGRFLWHNGDSPLSTEQDYGDHLPAALFKLLEGNIRRPGRVTEVVKSYATAEAAQAALSRACVAYGRSLAKLPALS